MKTVDDYMSLQWEPRVVELPEGDFSLTVPPLDDFEMFSESRDDLLTEWRDALRVHLSAYLAVQKWIPRPLTLQMIEEPIQTGSPGWDCIEATSLGIVGATT